MLPSGPGNGAVTDQRTLGRASDRTPLLPGTFWVLVTTSAALLPSNADYSNAQFAVSMVALTFGAWSFWQHGRNQLTVAGIYGFCSAIFVGFSGLNWWSLGQSNQHLLVATFACAITNVLMYYIFWYRLGTERWPTAQPRGSDPLVVQSALMVGAVLTLVGAGASTLELGPEALSAPVAFVGVTMLCVSLAAQTTTARQLGIVRLLIVAGACGVYVQYTFSGYGRLVLASLGLVVAASLCLRLPGRTVKALGLIGSGPAIAILVRARENFGVAEYGYELDGLGSITAPLQQFAVMVQGLPDAQLGHGSTFWAALVTHVPSGLWTDKPEGFGLVLAHEYNPTLASIGGTLAALDRGEWLYNFGWWGVVAMVPAIGLLVLWADRWLFGSVHKPLATKRALLGLSAALIVAGSMGDYLWGGAHTFTGRAGTRLLVVLALTMTWAAIKIGVEQRGVASRTEDSARSARALLNRDGSSLRR